MHPDGLMFKMAFGELSSSAHPQPCFGIEKGCQSDADKEQFDRNVIEKQLQFFLQN
jgi:hypothetical protein